MDAEAQVAEAMRSEFRRQAEAAPGELTVSELPDALQVSGRVDMEALAMAVIGAIAGGP
ncbi:hypothetical protein [Brevundimonas sp. NIBR11]|uniref:hypothetical protein n=1 Tax=Brevundimonas sp. NIBR11 TaxID=3015999 RepID=UPI0022F09F9E|nr:hypothetical protein [Brevundimonas sp. NIBR11]WGM31522.1 hypothetical protein KKHFBJBL_01769 [Brevundimonas sp. NIBR11]